MTPKPTTPQPLHERYYQATKAMHNARTWEERRNRQADVQDTLKAMQQQDRYNQA